MMQTDFHMHTGFSTDSDTSPRAMIEASIQKGLKTICITDHNDKDFPHPELFDEDEPFVFEEAEYFQTLQELRREYQSKIDVRIGVEIGMQEHLVSYYNEFVQAEPFDFVIASMHIIHGMDPYYPQYFAGRSDEEGYREAFAETARMLRMYDNFDVLGHIDYIVRYGRNREQDYSYAKYAEELDEILRLVIEKGKGIELNTAGYKYGLGFAHPHPDILRRYRKLGGEILTIGADGHKPEHVAYDFSKVSALLTDCGFKYYTEFSQRKPIFKQLP
ncbi:MAG: histidinol-phosphatase HisJ family protein [Hespellia sp.]|nr:histidinol-phosphatase HisJ family protein [Hespellia sp.]